MGKLVFADRDDVGVAEQDVRGLADPVGERQGAHRLATGGNRVTLPDGLPAPHTSGLSSTLDTLNVWKMTPGGSTVWTGVFLDNRESLPIKVTSIGTPIAHWAGFGAAHVRIGDSAEFAGASPLHPFVLEGHEFIQAYLKIHMGCVVTHDDEVAEISSQEDVEATALQKCARRGWRG